MNIIYYSKEKIPDEVTIDSKDTHIVKSIIKEHVKYNIQCFTVIFFNANAEIVQYNTFMSEAKAKSHEAMIMIGDRL